MAQETDIPCLHDIAQGLATERRRDLIETLRGYTAGDRRLLVSEIQERQKVEETKRWPRQGLLSDLQDLQQKGWVEGSEHVGWRISEKMGWVLSQLEERLWELGAIWKAKQAA